MNATTISLDAPSTLQATAPALRLITCGSVDDGKSTLIGRLLVDSKSVLQDQLAGVQRSGETDLALLTDGLSAEREQGITIDVAYRYFATPGRTPPVATRPQKTRRPCEVSDDAENFSTHCTGKANTSALSDGVAGSCSSSSSSDGPL